MNYTVTLSQLITRLATVSGVDTNTARRFLQAFFHTLSDSIEQTGSVSIKGIGTFTAHDDPSTGRPTVTFAPDPAVAEELNRPFEMFEAVELADNVDFSEADEFAINIQPDADNTPTNDNSENGNTEEELNKFAPIEPIYTAVPEVETPTTTTNVADDVKTPEADEITNTPEPEKESDTIENADEVSTEQVEVKNQEETVAPAAAEEVDNAEDGPINIIEEPDNTIEPTPSNKRLWIWAGGIVAGVAIIAYIAAVILTPINSYEDEDETLADTTSFTIQTITVDELNAEKAEAAPTEKTVQETTTVETPQEAPATTKAEPVYDTVEISLIRLAKKHYNEPAFWVYIYEANTDIITNPNRIRPGTRVFIPNRDTFPGKDKKEAREIAKKKQSEILAKF